MTSISQWQSNIVPAQLAYLAIYSPALGPTDETFEQQLCFYYSRAAAEAKAQQRKSSKATPLPDQTNEQLRQIGLAQGLVDFAKTFSDGKPVDSVSTEKSCIILHQLEDQWWLLASVDLTRIPLAAAPTTKTSKPTSETQQYEYSSREISPPSLLVQQIKQAHSIFTLHHGPSLVDLYTRLGRERYCSTLERFWTRFSRTWDVLLHGNPAVDALAGIKLASGGELGVGAGEEEWGSGERCVLEEFVHQTEGLVDTVVARFGEPASPGTTPKQELLPWIGAGDYPSVSDGIVFGGVGGITRSSLQSVSLWMRHIYTYGEHAYGVRDNPSRERRRRKRRNISEQLTSDARSAVLQRNRSSSRSVGHTNKSPVDTRPQLQDRVASQDHAIAPNIPPPIVTAAEAALNEATRKAEQASSSQNTQQDSTMLGIPDQYVKYLTFGLSTFVKPTKTRPPLPSRTSTSSSKTLVQNKPADEDDEHDSTLSVLDPMPDGEVMQASIVRQRYQEDKGYFVIGLKGDLDSMPVDEEAELTEGSLNDNPEDRRTVLRTVYVNALQKVRVSDNDSDETLDAAPESKLLRLRVLIYVHRPFIYCFLFEQRTSSLSYASLYRNIHHNLMPIHKPLLNSTQPSKVAARIDNATAQDATNSESGIYDLLYDPERLTVHSSVPNIPDPGSLAAEGILSNARHKYTTSWTRLDALNVHNAILNTLDSTSHHQGDLERTSRTNRNWWVVWMKIPAFDTQLNQDVSMTSTAQHQSEPQSRIALIVRKAVDSQPVQPSTSSRAASGMWSTLLSRSGDSTPDKIVGLSSGGIGFDARKYVEGLLSLNR